MSPSLYMGLTYSCQLPRRQAHGVLSDIINNTVTSLLCPVLLLGFSLAGCGGGADTSQQQTPLVHHQPADNTQQQSHAVPLPLADKHSDSIIGNLGPQGNSGLVVGDVRYPLDTAIGDEWGASDSHYQIAFTLANGAFSLESVLVDGRSYKVLTPRQSSAVFFARVFSPGSTFEFASYAFTPDNTSISDGVGYFAEAYVGIDENRDGTVNDAERLSVVDGTIDFTGTQPDIQINVSITLSNGQSVTGEYTGLLDFIER